MNKTFILFFAVIIFGCSNMSYTKTFNRTVEKLDLNKFMGKWYVVAGRVTFLERGAHNAVEEYTWNHAEKRIDINFYYNKDSFSGALKKIPQKAWIVDSISNARWHVSPFWPLKFDYLVVDLAKDYSWTAIGVPSGKYLWIMSREWNTSPEKIEEIKKRLTEKGYPVDGTELIPQSW